MFKLTCNRGINWGRVCSGALLHTDPLRRDWGVRWHPDPPITSEYNSCYRWGRGTRAPSLHDNPQDAGGGRYVISPPRIESQQSLALYCEVVLKAKKARVSLIYTIWTQSWLLICMKYVGIHLWYVFLPLLNTTCGCFSLEFISTDRWL